MEDIKLSVEVRAGSTKKALSALRGKAGVPGVIYGGGKPPVSVAVAERDLLAARKRGGVNAILHLRLGASEETVMVKELQRHPVTDRLVHADFQRVSMTAKMTAKVPLRVVGEAPGVKNSGGTLQYELRELSVRALPADIPHDIAVDVSRLELNHHILVEELTVPSGVEVLDPAQSRVVHVTTVKVIEEAPAAAPAAAEAAAAEPESASTKGKKDEEGKLVKETAKAGAPAPEKKEGGKKEGKKEGEK
ncbi:MAG: 50S ribosomal protein L25 [Elusimicrobia bacterium]|nr:50S ribosomal protein L25 [Elusimicrobiota bacterium]